MRAREPRAGYALFAFAAAAVFVASVVDPPTGGAATAAIGSAPSPLGVPVDKWVHAATYAVLAALLCYVVRARTTRAVILAAVAVAGYGFAIELVQATLPARTFDPADALANAAGAVLAALAWRAMAAFDPF